MSKQFVDPTHGLYALIGLLYGFMIVFLQPQEPAVFFLFTLSIAVLVVRLRFGFNCALIGIDLTVYLIVLMVFDEAALFVLPTLLMMLFYGKLYSVFIAFLLWFGFFFLDATMLLMVVLMLFSGFLLLIWNSELESKKSSIDRARIKLYNLEQEHDMILKTQDELSRVSALSERDRIAQKLHDDLGHELTGAVLALRALESNAKDLLEDKMFIALKQRLESSVTRLKETVQGTNPKEVNGFDAFKELAEAFEFAKVNFKQSGDLLKLGAHHWHILISVLKESLTNVQKHSQAQLVEVELLVTGAVVRLMVKNDGVIEGSHGDGFGLKYMRKRIESLGGNFSVQSNSYFTLVCVLPLQRGA